MPLTAAQSKHALAMWNDNVGAASIGAEFRVSRNAIMGYVHRWRKAGLVDPNRGHPAATAAPAPEIQAAPEPNPIAAPIEPAPRDVAPEPVAPSPVVTPEPKPLPRERAPEPVRRTTRPPVYGAGPAVLALRARDCRWPFRDVGDADFRFCCEPARSGPVGQPPYCEAHLRKALSGPRALARFGIEP